MNDTSTDADKLRAEFERAGQGQVFRFFDELDEESRERLLRQASDVDLAEVTSLVETHLRGGGPRADDLSGLEPAPFEPLPSNGGDPALWAKARETGEAALADGRVAAFTVAGGQGTRLGFDGPKGTFPVTPVSGKTLFQVFAEKIARTGERYGVTVPWFIMTSAANHEATVAAFEAADYFGLGRESVRFFTQGLVPAVDFGGRILLEDKATIAMTPDGHGGSLRALERSGSLRAMADAGIDVISYFQVDNPLVQCLDPAFIGFHVMRGSELSSKMVPKAYPEEKVGLFCRQGETTKVIEYSDMPGELQAETAADGSLRYKAGSVAIHIFDRDFAARVGGGGGADLPFHRANKKIPHADAEGNPVSPDEPNGVKFEMFVFDALPLAKDPVIIEAAREDDFSPVKNAEGVDSPRTAKEDQLRMFARWLKAAGSPPETDGSGLPKVNFEISHRFAVDEADFVERWKALSPKPTVGEGTVIESGEQ